MKVDTSAAEKPKKPEDDDNSNSKPHGKDVFQEADKTVMFITGGDHAFESRRSQKLTVREIMSIEQQSPDIFAGLKFQLLSPGKISGQVSPTQDDSLWSWILLWQERSLLKSSLTEAQGLMSCFRVL